MPDTSEIWKPITGYEDLYEVSNLGRVKRIGPGVGAVVGRLLKPAVNNRGYLYVTLSKHAKCSKFTVHRLVAGAFVPNPDAKPHVNHKDTDTLNNHGSNLEWVTVLENNHHSLALGHQCCGEQSPHAKLTEAQVIEIRLAYATGQYFQRELAVMHGVTRRSIGDIINRVCWKHI